MGAAGRIAWAGVSVLLAVTGCGLGGDQGTATGGAQGTATSDQVWTAVRTGGFVTSVAALGEGFVAAQDVNGAGQVLFSAEGVSWTVVDTGVVADGEQLSWVTGGPYGAGGEIIGAERPEVVVTTDGATFTRADPVGDLGFADVGIIGMAWGPRGIAVVLSRGGQPMGLVVSEDGRSWSTGALPADLVDLGDPGSSPVAATERGYVIVGNPASEANPGAQAWSSPDLVQWRPEEVSPRFVGGMGSPVGWAGGFVLWGEDSDDPASEDAAFTHRTWSTTGDGTWTELEVSGVDLVGGLVPVAGSEAGVFAISWREPYQDLDVLYSPDLLTWQHWTQQEAFGTSSPDEVLWGSAAMGPDAVVVPVGGGFRVARP